jgi:hypothetical protein
MVRRTFFDGNPKNWMPLGSFLDYNPHDLLLMKKKLAVWRDRYRPPNWNNKCLQGFLKRIHPCWFVRTDVQPLFSRENQAMRLYESLQRG